MEMLFQTERLARKGLSDDDHKRAEFCWHGGQQKRNGETGE